MEALRAPAAPPEPAPAPADPGTRAWMARGWLVATWLVVAVGAALRLRQWWHGRSYWLDELLLLGAMRDQRFGELLRPLDNAQSAPPAWLLVQHVVVGLTGESERGARLLPLLLGIGTLVLVALLGRALFGPPAALVATALVAVSPQLIRYSDEFKQYSGDAFWVLLVALVAVRLVLRPTPLERPPRLLAAVAATVVWWSHAGALATFGMLGALLAVAAARRRWREVRLLAVAAAPAAMCFAGLYAVLLSATADNPRLRDYWAPMMPAAGRLTPSVAADWLGGRLRAVSTDPLNWRPGALVATVVLAGLAALAVRRPPAAVVLLGGVGAVFAAGLAGRYPVHGRLALFLAPLVALVVAATVDLPAVAGRLGRGRGRAPATAAAVVLALAAVAGTVQLSRPLVARDLVLWHHPLEQEQSRDLYGAIAVQRQPGDLVLVDERGGRYSAALYGPRSGLGPYELLAPRRPGPDCPAGWLGDRLTGVRRVWLVTVHTRATDSRDYRSQLERWGTVTRQLRRPGALVLQFTRSAGPPPAGGPPPRCLLRVSG